MFITKKRCRRVKTQGCANGRNHREIYSKEEAASLTVLLEAILLASVIGAKEGRDITTTDILITYLNADMDDKLIMMMEGRLAALMAQIAPEIYRK
eukprot:5896116-Ditylum_brightwellii.AAC.1